MTLAARICNTDGEVEIPAHQFGGMCIAWFRGVFGQNPDGRTRMLDVLNATLSESGWTVLTASEEAELDTMKAAYDAKSQIDALEYSTQINDYSGLLQKGILTASEWETQLGIT